MIPSSQPSGTIEDDRLIPPRDPIPGYPGAPFFYAPYSHSMVLTDHNALIYQRSFFRACQRTDWAIRQKFGLLISKANFDDRRFARFQRLSTSIGRFFHDEQDRVDIGLGTKNTVSLGSNAIALSEEEVLHERRDG